MSASAVGGKEKNGDINQLPYSVYDANHFRIEMRNKQKINH